MREKKRAREKWQIRIHYDTMKENEKERMRELELENDRKIEIKR
jgi:hypothetical protein